MQTVSFINLRRDCSRESEELLGRFKALEALFSGYLKRFFNFGLHRPRRLLVCIVRLAIKAGFHP